MKTESIIAMLAADQRPEPPPAGIWVKVFVPAVAVAAAVVGVTLGYRADLMQSLGNPMSVARFALTGALCAVSLSLAHRLARPEAAPGKRLWLVPAIGVAALGLVGYALGATPREGWQMALEGKTQVTCLVAIPLLSVLPVLAALAALRQGAVTRPRLAAAAAGLAGSSAAACAYALHCTEDSPLFYVTWYGLGIALVTALSALVGQRLLRW